MSSLFLLILISLGAGLAAWLLFLWAVRSGQYDDVEGPKYRMLSDGEAEKNARPPEDEDGKQG